MSAEFDKYSKTYRTALESAVQSTGFDLDHFVSAKLDKLRRINPDLAEAEFNFLDYGCGPGNLCKNFHDYFPQGRYCGVDASEEMVRQARNVHTNKGEFFGLESANWKQKNFALVFAAGVFHHIPPTERPKVVAELFDRCEPSGKIVVWEHNPWNPFTQKIVRDCEFDQDAVLLSCKNLEGLLKGAGFTRVRTVFVTFFPKALSGLLPLESYLEWCPLGGQYATIAHKAG